MKNSSSILVKAACLSIALLGSTAVVAVVAMPDAAFAKGSQKEKKSKEAKSERSQSAKPAKTNNARAEKPANHPSNLGALNAAHASENAMLHASPNSRVGRIAAYRDLVVEGQALDAEISGPLALAIADLEALEANKPARDAGEIFADIEDAMSVDPVDEALVEELNAELDDFNTYYSTYDADYAALNTAITDYQLQLDEQKAAERTALEAAANKPVNDDIEQAVKEMLGLL